MACDVHTALFSSLINGVNSLYTNPCTVCSYIRVEKSFFFQFSNLDFAATTMLVKMATYVI